MWLVEQFNAIKGFLGSQSIVESFQAHFYNPDSDELCIVLLTFGKDIPLLERYDDFEFTITNAEGKVLEPDFDPEEFMSFAAAFAIKKERD